LFNAYSLIHMNKPMNDFNMLPCCIVNIDTIATCWRYIEKWWIICQIDSTFRDLSEHIICFWNKFENLKKIKF